MLVTEGSEQNDARLPRVLVSVLNYNSVESTLDAIDCLRRQRYRNSQLQMVDNGSAADCVTQIREVFPDLDIVRSHSNLGYTGGNNLALERGSREGFDYVLVCNQDIVVGPEAVGYLVEAAEASPDAGVVGGIETDYESARVRTTGATRFPNWRCRVRWPVDARPKENPWRKVLFVQGSLVMFTRRALELGMRFNDDLFMYWDEIDLGYALCKQGLAAYVDYRVEVRHHNQPALLNSQGGYLQQRNRVYIARRHFPSFKKVAYIIYSTLVEVPGKVLVRTLQGNGQFARACLLGHWDGLRGRMGRGRLPSLAPGPARRRAEAGC